MENYYRILEIDASANEDAIREALNRELRIWSNRTNAPQMEKRQEAERIVNILQEAETVLLDPAKKAEYDRQLQTAAPQAAASPSPAPSGASVSDLVTQGWNLLDAGKVADALAVATQAVQIGSGDPSAWKLLGQSNLLWGETENAIQAYHKAIILQPNDASSYYDLGNIYESAEMWQDALTQYERASKIDPSSTMYKAAISLISSKLGHYTQSIEILERCLQEEPENEVYKWDLALAYVNYADSMSDSWTYVPDGGNIPSGYYATSRKHINDALIPLAKAESLQITDKDMLANINSVKNNITRMKKRKFNGDKYAISAAAILGLALVIVGHGSRVATFVGSLFLIFSILYVLASFTPQYILNKRAIEGKWDTTSDLTRELMRKFSWQSNEAVGFILGLAVGVVVLPFITIANFMKNYVMN